MASADAGVRIVARALPGSGGSAARARASAACFAAWRAAHGAAPRSPSFRFEAEPPFGSSLITGLPGLPSDASADDFFPLDAFEATLDFFFTAEAFALVVGFVAF